MRAPRHNIVTVLLLSAAPVAASPGHRVPPAAGSQLPGIQAREDVAGLGPLCDQDGYPLIGNVANKGDMYQPSQFCSDVRKTEKRT